MEKFTKSRIGHFTVLYQLKNIKDRKDRYITYNDITFRAIQDLSDNSQAVIINESKNGGYVLGTKKYAVKAIEKLRKANPEYHFDILKTIENGSYKKISFAMNKNSISNFKIK